MAHKIVIVGLSMIVAAAPALASQPEPRPATGAPLAGPNAEYCMHIEAITGTRIEEVKCWTRQEWAEQGVDVDRDWAREGVRVIDG
jgi:hypothetical protein